MPLMSNNWHSRVAKLPKTFPQLRSSKHSALPWCQKKKSPNPKQELQPQNQRGKWEKERSTREERGEHSASFLIRKKRRPYRLASPSASTGK